MAPILSNVTVEGNQLQLRFDRDLDLSVLLASASEQRRLLRRFTVDEPTARGTLSLRSLTFVGSRQLNLTIDGAGPLSSAPLFISYNGSSPDGSALRDRSSDPLLGSILLRHADTFRSGSSVLSLAARYRDLVITGSAIRATGNDDGNIITVEQGSVNNVLIGGGGSDVLDGGDGSDIYIVNYRRHRPTGEVRDSGSSGIDELRITSLERDFPWGLPTEVPVWYIYPNDTGLERVVVGTGTGEIADTSGFERTDIDSLGAPNRLIITGNNAINRIRGTMFGDTIIGNGGDDVLNGYFGSDRLEGGAGRDTFLFDTALNSLSNRDEIVDFSPSEDRIQLSRRIFTGLPSFTALSPVSFGIGNTATSLTQRILYNSVDGQLLYDADGSGMASSPILFASVSSGLPIRATNFVTF